MVSTKVIETTAIPSRAQKCVNNKNGRQRERSGRRCS